MNIKLIFLFISILITISCTPRECRDVEDIKLKLLMDYSPLVDTFSIGDTLSVFSDFSDMIEDNQSGELIPIEDFKFYSLVIIRKFVNGISVDIDTQEDQILNTNVNFSFQNYTLSKGTGINIEKHNYEGNQYNFSFDFVFRKSGLYVIGVDSFLGFSNSTDNQQFEGQCPNQEISANYYRSVGERDSNLEDYNYEMFRQADLFNGFTEADFKKFAWYAFYVKE